MRTCDGSIKLSGTWNANTPPDDCVRSKRLTTSMRSSLRSHCSTALEKNRSVGDDGVYDRKSATRKSIPGRVDLAFWIMSGEESSPTMWAPGYRAASTAVEFPGPQPRSTIVLGASSGTRASSSRAGSVLSSANLRYCDALQSLVVVGFAVDIVRGVVRVLKERFFQISRAESG